jgi:hypothetical protein
LIISENASRKKTPIIDSYIYINAEAVIAINYRAVRAKVPISRERVCILLFLLLSSVGIEQEKNEFSSLACCSTRQFNFMGAQIRDAAGVMRVSTRLKKKMKTMMSTGDVGLECVTRKTPMFLN